MRFRHPLMPTLAALAVVVIGASFFAGVSVGLQSRPDIDRVTGILHKEEYKPEAIDFAPFWKTWNVINEKYVTANGGSSQDKVWGAIAGLAGSLKDPYTIFFPPEELKQFQASIDGNFEGVGMEVDRRDDVLTVVAPLKGTPAQRAGILAGDRILAIDGTSTAQMSVERAVRLIRGEKGTTVKLLIARDHASEPIEISIVRQVITIPTIETEFQAKGTIFKEGVATVGDGVFVIRLFSFSANAPAEFRNSLRAFLATGSHKLIIDVRGNPGGFLEAAVDMASWFLPVGKVVVKEELSKGKEGRVYRSRGYNVFNKNLKLVVLIDKGSASASEIFAGALREHGIATLVGEQSFGKGSVQELVPITPDTSLKITVARWLTPKGVSISKAGLSPDVVVKVTKDDIKAKKDTQLLKAKEIVLEK